MPTVRIWRLWIVQTSTIVAVVIRAGDSIGVVGSSVGAVIVCVIVVSTLHTTATTHTTISTCTTTTITTTAVTILKGHLSTQPGIRRAAAAVGAGPGKCRGIEGSWGIRSADSEQTKRRAGAHFVVLFAAGACIDVMLGKKCEVCECSSNVLIRCSSMHYERTIITYVPPCSASVVPALAPLPLRWAEGLLTMF